MHKSPKTTEWVPAGTRDEIQARKISRIHTGDRWVALHLWRDKVFAIDDSCPHRGASLAESCADEAGYIECWHHNWEYQLESGAGRFDWQGCVATFAVKEEDGVIFVSRTPRA
jgi:nitrite reductase/ring-hydroxylating ferredoxin subunit